MEVAAPVPWSVALPADSRRAGELRGICSGQKQPQVE